MAKPKSRRGGKKRRSPLQVAYSKLQKTKTKNCDGKADSKALSGAKKTYIDRAVKAGQSRTEATKKANRVVNKPCPVK